MWEQRTRDRVTGAVVLVSLAVIFLPMVFDGDGVERRPLRAEPVSDLPERQPPSGLEQDTQAWAFVDRTERLRERPPEAQIDARPRHSVPEQPLEPDAPPAVDDAGVPEAYAVQLASFEERDNARALRDRLLEDGFEAYVTQTRTERRTLSRVAVGPRVRFSDAETLKRELESRYDLEGLLVQFKIDGGAR